MPKNKAHDCITKIDSNVHGKYILVQCEAEFFSYVEFINKKIIIMHCTKQLSQNSCAKRSQNLNNLNII